ncbi:MULTISPECIES: hypothetical protein [Paenibacillus]|uniref:Regulatory protein YrvL n=1 Tax=Paenibacillus pabuli TaxID=1472 RepID=A0A855XV80_9BACL|nr:MULTISPECIES: hypothetical protein [Paenibacillus]PWW38850.1 hypothetical protein DET56_107252 [Paenibacillus pabuli]PXW06035.1 hypothetical protein DEU73_107252 [Paenibacillus taichungensis]
MLLSAVQRFLVLGIEFVIVMLSAVIALEFLEGFKIGTSEYYGLRNAGHIYFLLIFITFSPYVFAFYTVVVSPLSWLLRKYVPFVIARVLVYSVGCGLLGSWVFDQMFSNYMIESYHLNRATSIWIFALAGVIYAVVENRVIQRYKSRAENIGISNKV